VIEVLQADESHARAVLDVIRDAFGNRPVLDPPATALDEDLESVAAALRAHGGLLVLDGGRPVGTLIFEDRDDWLGLRRVGVISAAQGRGVAQALAENAARVAYERGYRGLELEARAELPRTQEFWRRQGYCEASRVDTRITMRRLLPVVLELTTAADTTELGHSLAAELQAGDLLILTGDLGAGKTTFTQGLGAGLGVRGAVTSPTFVIARVHPSLNGGPELVHVDAYRLGGSAELDDLDLDTDLDQAVTVVEWGEGLAESLAEDRIEINLVRREDDVREATITRLGSRWVNA
jgi:tRNA threonylcarbamoyladenosine biosynthesis protein TsaE